MAKKFKPGQPVWYFDHLGTVALEGPQERVFKRYRLNRFQALISSPYGYDVAIQAGNVYPSPEAALLGAQAKREADALLDAFDYEALVKSLT